MTRTPVIATSRPYAGEQDLPPLLAFADASANGRFPLDATWRPSDIAWALKGARDARHAMRLWASPTGAGVAAVAWIMAPGGVWLECRPDCEALVPDAIAWAEASLRGERPRQLAIRAFEGDLVRTRALEALGYRRSGPESVIFRRSLAGPLPDPSLPPGMRLRDSVGVDPVARAACHRDAWNHLDHIGIANAQSAFTTELYRDLSAGPLYDPSLDILVETGAGELVANCICWADESGRVGTFEPVGTCLGFRGQGLARAVTLEGLQRLKTRGMAWARVSTAHFNAPAIATYLSCGFQIIDHAAWWSRTLD